jgi:hypothetical protein
MKMHLPCGGGSMSAADEKRNRFAFQSEHRACLAEALAKADLAGNIRRPAEKPSSHTSKSKISSPFIRVHPWLRNPSPLVSIRVTAQSVAAPLPIIHSSAEHSLAVFPAALSRSSRLKIRVNPCKRLLSFSVSSASSCKKSVFIRGQNPPQKHKNYQTNPFRNL